MERRATRRRFVTGAITGGAALTRVIPSAGAHASGGEASPEASPPGGGEAFAISGVTLIDGTDAPPKPNTSVVIEGERIAEVRPADSGATPQGMRVVDGAGRYLIPGLWDSHVHAFVFPWQADRYFPLLIANGVTGIRDMGGAFPMSAIDEIRAAIASGARVGPRIVAGIMVDGPIPVWPFSLRAGTAEEGREAVATIAEAGADFVKVYTLLPRVAFEAIAEAANERGLPFAGHVPIAVTPAEASDAGQRSVEHYSDSILPFVSSAEEEIVATLRAAASGPDPVQAYAAAFFGSAPRLVETFDPEKTASLAAHLAANQTWFTPTLIIGQTLAMSGDPAQAGDPRLRYLPAAVTASWNPGSAVWPPELLTAFRRSVELGEQMSATMQGSGVPLLAGTDLGLPNIFPGFSLHDELALLVAAGLTPLQALHAATRNPARCFGLERELGTVEPGKIADLVLLDADPLADIANAGRIAAVVATGRLFEKRDIQEMMQAAERAAATPPATPPATPLP
jgi:imidazolonepropionase-like amidohydrolase